MSGIQKRIRLPEFSRGFHLVTGLIEAEIPEIAGIEVGLLHLFIQHTSASLTINENADPTVRQDFESHFERAVPEDAPYYRHTAEGPDDMPAHIKASLMGSSVTIPISGGRLALGTWQGIYLCEHRDRGGRRSLVATVMGD
ncbi:MAG: secondary thiamine-phosphate synthase enzyme YjbQ [marine benthic group bacterium]|nr:secondary thiamine-phosphate synthase enzyme YjbQ [Gemmatimonadota bacterium]